MISLAPLVLKPRKVKRNSVKSVGQAASTAALLASGIATSLMKGSLAQLWGMINGMQIAVHLTAFNVNLPDGPSKVFVEALADIATFDTPFLNVSYLVGKLPNDTEVFVEEEGYEALKERIDGLGYESHYMGNVMGSIYIFMLATIIGLFLIILLTLTRFRKL